MATKKTRGRAKESGSVTRQLDPPSYGASLKQDQLSVGAIIRSAFPRGTKILRVFKEVDGAPDYSRVEIWSGNDELHKFPLDAKAWSTAPPLPPDVFAVAALLLDISGGAHHVLKSIPAHGPWPRPLVVPATDWDNIKSAVLEWRETGLQNGRFKVPHYIQQLWDKLWKHRHDRVFVFLSPDDGIPEWWLPALCLLISADEASFQFGFQATDKKKNFLEQLFETDMTVALKRIKDGKVIDDKRLTPEVALGEGRYTISTIPPDLACVLPKSRTAQIGCTLRSLSLNLALLPPRGKARAIWHCPSRQEFDLRKDTDPLNLLLVPHPFQLSPSSFVPLDGIQDEASPGRWGWFGVRQGWQPKSTDTTDVEDTDAIVRFVRDLVKNAASKAGPVHGIVFPELSLTQKTFDKLRNEIAATTRPTDAFSEVDLLVAGLRTDAHGAAGNFATACLISRPSVDKDGKISGDGRVVISNTQQKHHRWRLNQRQINGYGIGASLTNGVTWWEGLPLLSRSLNVFVFRRGSTLVPLICEDLARLEPVHDLVRSIGPNLVIALLMDGPQISDRWPGRYAMGLADDPGSSVLTLTSFGAVKRSADRISANRRSYSVGLWRDQLGDTTELTLEDGASAILLSLSGQRAMERTIDGRHDDAAARVWVFADQTNIFERNAPDWAARRDEL